MERKDGKLNEAVILCTFTWEEVPWDLILSRRAEACTVKQCRERRIIKAAGGVKQGSVVKDKCEQRLWSIKDFRHLVCI